MVDYIRKCSKVVGEIVVIEIAQERMRTRAVAAEEVTGAEKRRKLGNGELRLPSSTTVQITTEEDSSGPCAAVAILSCDHVPLSSCSSNESVEELQFTDLKGSVEIGTFAKHNFNTRPSKPICEFKAGSGVLKNTTVKPSTVNNTRCTMPVEKMPPAAELEDFFASMEKDLHERFKDKYNFDIVNDTPLEGRFDWVQLKP